MKLCITSTGRDMAAIVDTAFGRASFFLIIDTETKETEVVDNSAASQTQGAGIAAAQLITNKGVNAVLTGYVGPNASNALQQSDIMIYEGLSPQDTVQEALTKFTRGEYRKAESAAPEEAPFRPGQGRGLGRGMGRGMGQGHGQGRGRCRKVK
ncbi:NifB/NifX family molybdenum-iron cluster-binding protein [Desulfosediminicola flagellatus]|uniref:NifB/NifX family molybdenum-iron cluster-binding protein n=1 Tax=Desulfosediminicola flagellatus TaxID=2569541 RepID=UPI0010AC21EF|nr:NifB/NifX family molybdenum-iron cluster-binding protein [Desulfosediminicola flagellatus]